MELPPRLGLGTINIVPLCGRTSLTTRVWVRNLGLGDRKVLGTQPHPTRGSASSHCVLHLDLIKDSFNIFIYTYTHTLASSSNQHGNNHPKNPNIHLSYHLIQGSKQQNITRPET